MAFKINQLEAEAPAVLPALKASQDELLPLTPDTRLGPGPGEVSAAVKEALPVTVAHVVDATEEGDTDTHRCGSGGSGCAWLLSSPELMIEGLLVTH